MKNYRSYTNSHISYLLLTSMAAMSGAWKYWPPLFMVRDHRGREWSVATKDCPNFLRQVLSTLGQSKNPEIQYFQKLPNKNFKVLLKRFLLGSYDLPGFLDFWISGLLLTWRDYETKSRGRRGLCSPISSNQSYQVSMQPRPWLERSDQEPRSNRVPWKR